MFLTPLLLAACIPAAHPQAPAADERVAPIVVSGSDLPFFFGVSVDDITAYNWSGNQWNRVSCQVDERYDHAQHGILYVLPSAANDNSPTNDWAANNPSPGLTELDEIAIDLSSMADQAFNAEPNPPGTGSTRAQIHWSDPLNGDEGWVYLMQEANAGPDPGPDRVQYSRQVCPQLGSGLCSEEWEQRSREDTSISTAHYDMHFSMNWVLDEFRVKPAAGGSNVDLIDRWKGRAYASGPSGRFGADGEVEDHEDSITSAACGWSRVDGYRYYLGHIDGPVRVIRVVKGACSFPDLIRTMKFSETHFVEQVRMAGHSFGTATGGLGFYWDFSPQALPMTYTTAGILQSYPSGITLDGISDFSTVNIAALSHAELLSGLWAQTVGADGGMLLHIMQLNPFSSSDPADNEVVSYYLDDNQYDDGTGTEFGVSGHGLRFLSIEDTEPVPVYFTSNYRPIAANTPVTGFEYQELWDFPPDINVDEINAGGNTPPVAVASASPLAGTPPLVVSFSSAGSYDPDGNITSHQWDFDDGNTSTNANPSHTYYAVGTYNALLTVTDNQGATDTDSVQVDVSNGNTPPIVDITSPPDGATFARGQRVYATSSAIDAEDGNLPASAYSWSVDLPIGVLDHHLASGRTDINGKPPYPGIYTLRLRVTDSDGLVGMDEVTFTVLP